MGPTTLFVGRLEVSLVDQPIDAVGEDSLDVMQILADAGGNATSSTSNGGPDRVPEPVRHEYDENETRDDQLIQLFTANSSSGSSSCGTSLSGGTSGAGSFALAAPILAIFDANVLVWVVGEWRFALPMPVGNELLRPPQRCA